MPRELDKKTTRAIMQSFKNAKNNSSTAIAKRLGLTKRTVDHVIDKHLSKLGTNPFNFINK
jgi:predicted transcriptional regulator